MFIYRMSWVVTALAMLACGESNVNNFNDLDGSAGTDPHSQIDSDQDPGSDNESTDPTDTNDPGWTPTEDGTVEVQDGGVVITEDDGTQVVCYPTICDGRELACGDCQDNDEDGKVDWRDPECLGPCDNTEGPALISDVGGVTGSTCHVDCYFDYGNGMGSGSDDCWWDHQCDPLEPEAPLCPYDEKKANTEKFCPTQQSPTCEEICLPFTPNGCDCFGCCTFPELAGTGPDGADTYVWIGAKDGQNNGTCTFKDILDREKCPSCTPVGNCLNECEKCEICIGKPLPPAECFSGDENDTDTSTDGPADGQCPDDVVPCGLPGLKPCDPGFYCISGCCLAVTLV